MLQMLSARGVTALLLPLFLILPMAQDTLGGTFANPDQVSVGTSVLITGSGFDGGKAPKVTAAREGEKKKVTFKVMSWSDTAINAVVKKVPSSRTDPAAGKVWDLTIQPQGPSAGPTIAAGSITTVAPRVLSVTPEVGGPGDEVVVQVQDSGSKTPKVLVNGRKSKVVDSAVDGAEGALDLKSFTVRLPNTHDGFFAVEAENKLGSNPSSQLVEISGSTKKWPKDGIKATVDGKKYNVKSKGLDVSSANGIINIAGETGKAVVRELFVIVPFNVSLDMPPATYVGDPTDSALFGYGELPADGIDPPQGWAGTEDSFAFVVNAVDGRRVQVSFDGLLQEQFPVEGEGGSTIRVKGSTYVTLQPTLVGTFALEGAQEVPPVATGGSGTATVTLDTATNQLSWNVEFSGLSSAESAAHIHGPANIGQNAGIVFNLGTGTPKVGSTSLMPDEAQQVEDGLWYINVHSDSNPGGELRGQIIVE